MSLQNEVCTLFHCVIEPSRFDQVKALVETLVEATATEETAISYEWVVNSDRTEMHIIERYKTAGVLPHIRDTFGPYASRFLDLVKIERLYVYGMPTDEIRATLDSFGAVYLEPFAGFRR